MARLWTKIPCLSEYVGSKRSRDFYHLLQDDEGKVVASLSWIGGHVERPDEWVVRIAGKPNLHLSCGTLDEAKTLAEEELAPEPEPEPPVFEAVLDAPLRERPADVQGTFLGTIPYGRDNQADVYMGPGETITMVFDNGDHTGDDYDLDMIKYLASAAGTPYAQRILDLVPKRC